MKGVQFQLDKIHMQVKEMLIKPAQPPTRDIFDINFYKFTCEALTIAEIIISYHDSGHQAVAQLFKRLVQSIKEARKSRPADKDLEDSDEEMPIYQGSQLAKFLNTRKTLKQQPDRAELDWFVDRMQEKQKDTNIFLDSLGMINNRRGEGSQKDGKQAGIQTIVREKGGGDKTKIIRQYINQEKTKANSLTCSTQTSLIWVTKLQLDSAGQTEDDSCTLDQLFQDLTVNQRVKSHLKKKLKLQSDEVNSIEGNQYEKNQNFISQRKKHSYINCSSSNQETVVDLSKNSKAEATVEISSLQNRTGHEEESQNQKSEEEHLQSPKQVQNQFQIDRLNSRSGQKNISADDQLKKDEAMKIESTEFEPFQTVLNPNQQYIASKSSKTQLPNGRSFDFQSSKEKGSQNLTQQINNQIIPPPKNQTTTIKTKNEAKFKLPTLASPTKQNINSKDAKEGKIQNQIEKKNKKVSDHERSISQVTETEFHQAKDLRKELGKIKTKEGIIIEVGKEKSKKLPTLSSEKENLSVNHIRKMTMREMGSNQANQPQRKTSRMDEFSQTWKQSHNSAHLNSLPSIIREETCDLTPSEKQLQLRVRQKIKNSNNPGETLEQLQFQDKGIYKKLKQLGEQKQINFRKIKFYIQNMQIMHKRICGKECIHLQRFYKYIKGQSWNKRIPLTMATRKIGFF